jgi:hypothetical protein
MNRLGFVGGYSYLPKTLAATDVNASRPLESFVNADVDKGWDALVARVPHSSTFRLVGEHTVPFHVLSALWIQKAGHIYDATLTGHVYAARVRRRYSEPGQPPSASDTSMGSFKPYQYGYRDWRLNGLAAIRRALADSRPVIVVTADLKRFYHETSPDFLLSGRFLRSFGISLSTDQMLLTRQLIRAIRTWARQTPEHQQQPGRGLPVGLSASRLIANVVLAAFDRFVIQRVQPLHYGRYVDDIFLVLDNATGLATASDVWNWLSGRSDGMLSVGEEDGRPAYRLQLPYSPGSNLRFAGDKQKVFALKGEPGIALLDSITKTVAERSSDWRLLPDLPAHPGQLTTDFIVAGEDGTEEVDSLRKSDGLSVRRLAFALRLRNCEAVARDLEPVSWAEHRYAFFRTVLHSVMTVPGLFDFGSYFPRLLGLAVACGDWSYGIDILRRLDHVFERTRHTTEADETRLAKCRSSLFRSCYEATLAAAPRVSVDDPGFAELLSQLAAVARVPSDPSRALELSNALYSADLAREPFRDAWLDAGPFAPIAAPFDPIHLPEEVSARLRVEDSEAFTRQSGMGWSQRLLRATVFPTRPFTVSEITLMDQVSLVAPARLRRWIRAMRGSELAAVATIGTEPSSIGATIAVPVDRRSAKPLIALPCIETKIESWKATVMGTGEPDSERYFRITKLVNDVLRVRPLIQYLVMPELSLPRKWFNRLAHKLSHSGVSLVAGLEYHHHSASFVSNQVRASLVTDQFGFTTPLMYVQEKERPAVKEALDLKTLAGKTLQAVNKPIKPVVQHGDFHFAILICSELTNLTFRESLRGRVDALIVPEWNPDINSFASFVESSALDVHCYVVQVNNRTYGDTRVRAPYRDLFRRDVARVKGGECDYFVVARIDVPGLRRFHSLVPSPPDEIFKPVPDGFVIAPDRRPPPS